MRKISARLKQMLLRTSLLFSSTCVLLSELFQKFILFKVKGLFLEFFSFPKTFWATWSRCKSNLFQMS
jgi:hypothetical protein